MILTLIRILTLCAIVTFIFGGTATLLAIANGSKAWLNTGLSAVLLGGFGWLMMMAIGAAYETWRPRR